jgi:hypothetical protein
MLNGEGGYDVETQTEDYCLDRKTLQRTQRRVQAVGLDAKDTPHPASRLDADANADRNFSGEVDHFLGGAQTGVKPGEMKNSFLSFAAGETFSCMTGSCMTGESPCMRPPAGCSAWPRVPGLAKWSE